MKNYINEIAKINKEERFNAIINVLKANDISYRIQNIDGYNNLGNIIVELNPNNKEKIVVCAHYDNVPGTPGANDNAAACSILLNLIEQLKNTDKHIVFIFTDLEEKGFIGSSYYLSKNNEDILYAINLDMCGIGNNIIMSYDNFSKDSLSNLKSLFDSYNVKILERLPIGDADSFILKNIPTFYIINSTDHDVEWFKEFSDVRLPDFTADFFETMHKPNDTPEKVNLNQVDQIRKFILDLINH